MVGEQTSSAVERAMKLHEGSVLASEVLRLRADVERLRSWAAGEQGDPLATPAQAEYALRTWQETAAGLAADVERLSAQRAAALAAADGWESDSSAFSTVPGFRRYVVDGIREALGATDA